MITYNMQEQAHKVEIAGEFETQKISWVYDPEHGELHIGQRPDKVGWLFEELETVTIPRDKLRSLRDYISKELNNDATTSNLKVWF